MKKRYIIIIVCLLIYLFVMFIFLPKKDEKKEKNFDYILSFNSYFWKYDGEKFVNEYNVLESIGTKKFYIYEEGEYKGYYSLGLYENEFYLFDDNNDSIKYSGKIIGFTDNNKHKIVQLNKQDIVEIDKMTINKIFNDYNLNYNQLNYSNVIKYTVDIDNDGKIESIYSISNVFDENNKDEVYSLIFVKDNDKIYELMKEIKSEQRKFSEGFEYNIENIIDIDNDGIMDFVISKSKYGSPDICYLLVQKENKEYKVTKSC